MATAKEIFETATDLAVTTIGRLATYMPLTGNPITNCSVNVETVSDPQPDGFQARVLDPETTLEYLLSEVGEEADINSYFTMADDGTVYTVKDLRENDGRTVTVVVKDDT
jgi:hypothetical protein